MENPSRYLRSIDSVLTRQITGGWTDCYSELIFATPDALDETGLASVRSHIAHDHGMLAIPRVQDDHWLNGFTARGQRWDQIATVHSPYEDQEAREVSLFVAEDDPRRSILLEFLCQAEQPIVVTDRGANTSYCLIRSADTEDIQEMTIGL